MTRPSTFRRSTLAAVCALALAAPAAQALTFTWSSGNFVAGVTAPSPLAAADILNIEAGGNKFFSGAASNFNNGGTVNWNADPLFLQSGAAVVNNALWNATSDQALFYNGGSAPSFTNNGSFRKSGGVGSTTINTTVGFVNNGTLDAQTGSISFVGGSVFNAGSVFTGAGSNVAAGNNTWNGSFNSVNLELQSGVHTGSSAVLGGNVGWSGGTLAGTWTVAAGQTLNGQAGSNKFVSGALLTNLGTIAWNTSDNLFLQSSGVVSNQGLFVANANTALTYNGGSQPAFDNTAGGTVRAAAGNTLTINTTTGFVNNGGVLDAQAGGSIRYAGGSVFNAGTLFTGAGSNVAAGNNTWNGGFNSGNLELQSGVHTGGAALLGGNVGWSGGTLAGTWNVAAGQTLNGLAGSNKFLSNSGTLLTNQGTVAWSTGNVLFLQSSAELRNQGTLDFSADGGVLYNGGAQPTFVNTGLIVKSGGSGTTSIGNTLGFDNQGTIDVQTGTIALPGNFSNNGTLKGSGTYSVSGTLSNAGTLAPGASPGLLSLAGSFAQTAAGTFAVELESLLSADRFNITGSAALDGTLALSCFAACSFAVGDSLVILASGGALSGSFDSVTLAGFNTGAFTVVYDTVGRQVRLNITQAVTAVPEPQTYALLLAGLVAVGFVARRRRQR